MKKENGNDMPFKADEVNWDELSGIGIMKYQVNRCLTAVSCLPHGKRETA